MISPGETVTIRQVSDWEPKELQYLCELGLTPGSRVSVATVAPFDGPLTLRIEGKNIAISQDIAQKIGVSRD